MVHMIARLDYTTYNARFESFTDLANTLSPFESSLASIYPFTIVHYRSWSPY